MRFLRTLWTCRTPWARRMSRTMGVPAALCAAVELAALPAPAQVAPGDLLVTSLATGLVYRLDPNAPAPVAPEAVPTGSAFVRPRGLAVDRNGLLLVADDAPKTLVRADPAANQRRLAAQFSTVSSALRGVAAASDGRVFAADAGLVPLVEPPLTPIRGITYFPLITQLSIVDGVTRGDPVAGCTTLVTGIASCGNLYLPTGVAIASEAPELVLLVADAGEPADPPPGRVRQGVIKVFPDRPFSPPLIDDVNDPPYPVTGDGVNDELFCAGEGSPFFTPRSVAVDRSPGREGSVLVTDSGDAALGEPARVLRVASSGCGDAGDPPVELVAKGAGLVRPIGIAVADDGAIFVADASADTVFRIDPDTDPLDLDGNGTGSVSPLAEPGSIDQAWDLQIQRAQPAPYFVADASVPALLAVSPAVPSRTTVSAGGALVAPATLELLPSAAGLLVADPTARAVIQAALGGAQTIASQAGRLTAPTSASREAGGTYLVTDLGDAAAEPPILPAVIRVDPGQPSPGNQTEVSVGGMLVRPIAGAIDADGFLIVADAGDGTTANPARILRIYPTAGLGAAGQAKLFENPDLIAPVALALDEGGGVILVADRGLAPQLPRVLRLVRTADEPPGAVDFGVVLASGGLLATPAGIALDGDRSILVTDQGSAAATDDGSVIRVDPLSALQSRVAVGAATDTLGLPAGIAVRAPAPGALPDQDGDGIADAEDNCISVANTDQRDTNGDRIGNICDPDYDGSGSVNNPDFVAIRRAFGANEGNPDYDEDLDADGDGTIGNVELLLVRSCFGTSPGASGPLLVEPPPAYCKPPLPAP